MSVGHLKKLISLNIYCANFDIVVVATIYYFIVGGKFEHEQSCFYAFISTSK